VFEQHTFAATAPTDNGQGLANWNLQINAAQNFLRPDPLNQPAHGNHRVPSIRERV
jgi:hypothetical protein